jgi:energy-coupling factor transporter ATP-binding protein EcfA2
MLTMIEKLVIEDCRIWKGHHEFEFGAGVNVIHGDNGVGKSTIAMMLMLTLTHSANSNVLKGQLLPKSGGSPKSSVTFVTQGGRFTISKVWGDRNQSQLIDADSNSVLSTGGEAEDSVRLLAFDMPPTNGNYSTNAGPMGNLIRNAATYLPSLAFHQQGDLHIAPEMGEQLRRIGLTFDDAEMAKALLSIAQGAEVERGHYIGSLRQDGRPRAGTDGKIVTMTNQLAVSRRKLDEARRLEDELNQAEDDLFEQQTREEKEISEENQQAIREEIQNLRSDVEAHRVAREDANQIAENLRVIHEPQALIKKEREEHKATLEIYTKSVEERSKEAEQKRTIFSTAQHAYVEAEAKAKEAKEQFENAISWNEHLTREKDFIEENAALKEVKVILAKRREDAAMKNKLEQERKAIHLPTEANWRAIREFDEQIAVAKASRRMEIRIHESQSGVEVIGDGELIGESGEAAERIEIRKGKKLLVEVNQAMSGKSPSELTLEKKQLLEQLGAETTADLQKRLLEANGLETSINTIIATLDALPSEESLNQKIALHESRLEKTVEKPNKACPEGILSEVIIRFEERQKMATSDLDSKNQAKTDALVHLRSAEALHTAAVATQMAKSTELEDHRTAHGLDEDITELESEGKVRWENANEVHVAFRTNKELKEDTPLERATLLQDNLNAYDARRAHVLQLAERVKVLRNNILLRELPSLEVEITSAERALEVLQFDHDAYQNLARIANAEQVNAQAQSRNQISEEMDRLLRHVWGGNVEIQLSDEGRPIHAQGISVDDESHGSREQLQTILRMVLLGEASGHAGTTMLLDDALVFADSGRLNRMKDVIRQSVRKDSMQMIVFSCRGTDYTDLAPADRIHNLNQV